MASTIHLRRKIKSIRNTKQITRAMQLVAASKLRRAQAAVMATRAYAVMGQALAARLQSYLSQQQLIRPPALWVKRPVGRIILIVIASDRGLAGAYNSNVLRRSLDFLNHHRDQQVKVVTIGRKAQEGLARAGILLEASFSNFPDRPTSQDILPIARLAVASFTRAECDQISIIYTHYYSTLRQVAAEKILLPIKAEAVEAVDEKYQELTAPLFEPDPAAILNYIGSRLIEIQLLQTILESIVSEHSSRMLAMKNATDNAGDLIDDLQLTYNSVRQASITREIAEISAGSNAQ